MNKKKRTLPKNIKALEKAYERCKKRKRFREVDSKNFQDYVVRSQNDLASAYNDLKNEDFHWARIKAYQALFHILNALLVKNLGYYSKDHGCVLTALIKNNILNDETASKLHLIVKNVNHDIKSKEDAIQDINDFRIQRNFALYKPKAWEEVTKEDIEQELDKIRNNIKILVDLL